MEPIFAAWHGLTDLVGATARELPARTAGPLRHANAATFLFFSDRSEDDGAAAVAAVGRPPLALRFGVLPALVVVSQMTSNELLHVHAIMLPQKQKSLNLLFSCIFASTMWCCPARVLVVLPLP